MFVSLWYCQYVEYISVFMEELGTYIIYSHVYLLAFLLFLSFQGVVMSLGMFLPPAVNHCNSVIYIASSLCACA